MARKRKTKTERQKLEARLWGLCRQVVLMRDEETCQRCKQPVQGRNAHVHHFVGRSQSKRLKYDVKNLVLLCFLCHQWWHDLPHESGPWFQEHYPDLVEYLDKRRHINGTVTLGELQDMESRLIVMREDYLELRA